MDKREILIVNDNMHTGGIQRALANLLCEIHGKYSVTLFLFFPEGELMGEIPGDVKIIRGNFFTRIMGMSQAEAKKAGLLTFAWRSFWVMITRLFGAGAAFGPLSKMQKIKKSYSAAISYMQNSAKSYFHGGCNEFVTNSVRADKKCAFVHCDFKNYKGNYAYNASGYRAFDAVACVSRSCAERFNSAVPGLEDKVITVHNCMNFEEIRRRADEYEAETTSGVLNIFSAARVAPEKGILRMFPILSELKKEGFSFVWRIAGDGSSMKEAQEMRKEYSLEKEVVFLGNCENPYPYFKRADLLLVPSYNEAAPMVFGEAACLGLPVLTTDTASAKELVGERGLGIVCGNTEEEIKQALAKILSEKTKLGVKAADLTNKEALSEFEGLLEKG